MKLILITTLLSISNLGFGLLDSYVTFGKASVELYSGEESEEIKSLTRRVGVNLDPLPGLNLSFGAYAEQSIATEVSLYLKKFEQLNYGFSLRTWLNVIPGIWAYADFSYLIDGKLDLIQTVGGYSLTGIPSYSASESLSYKVIDGYSAALGAKVTIALGHRVLLDLTAVGQSRSVFSGSTPRKGESTARELKQDYNSISVGYEWSL